MRSPKLHEIEISGSTMILNFKLAPDVFQTAYSFLTFSSKLGTQDTIKESNRYIIMAAENQNLYIKMSM